MTAALADLIGAQKLDQVESYGGQSRHTGQAAWRLTRRFESLYVARQCRPGGDNDTRSNWLTISVL